MSSFSQQPSSMLARGLGRVLISDTTLRDGEQMPSAGLDVHDRIEIARALATAGIDSIELGFPASSETECEAVKRTAEAVRGPAVSVLARATEADIDLAAKSLEYAPAFKRVVTVFIGTSIVHRHDKLGLTETQLLDRIETAVGYAKLHFHHVVFSAEDAGRTEREFLAQAFCRAMSGGATVLCFPDTVGIMTPEAVTALVRFLRKKLPPTPGVRLAAHFHNDLGLATANTLAAVSEGVRVLQCTVNGIGERAGNASLEEVAVALHVHADQYRVKTGVHLNTLARLSRLVAERTGIAVSPNKPIVGSAIFRTASGIHQDGLLKNPETYLPFAPQLVGLLGVELVLDRHSGRAAVRAAIRDIGLAAEPAQVEAVLAWLKSRPKGAGLDNQTVIRTALEEMTWDGE